MVREMVYGNWYGNYFPLIYAVSEGPDFRLFVCFDFRLFFRVVFRVVCPCRVFGSFLVLFFVSFFVWCFCVVFSYRLSCRFSC